MTTRRVDERGRRVAGWRATGLAQMHQGMDEPHFYVAESGGDGSEPCRRCGRRREAQIHRDPWAARKAA